ncbi:MAG TPA: DoxX family protein [Opitutaceae bacterium]
MNFFRLTFPPISVDIGLLLLRVGLGSSMLVLHGWGKLMRLVEGNLAFSDPIGLGPVPSLALAVFAEFLCSLLLIVGWSTHIAALAGAVTMAVAFSSAHGMRLTGEGNGELAFIYLIGYVGLFFAGGGRFSLDGQANSRRASKLKPAKK